MSLLPFTNILERRLRSAWCACAIASILIFYVQIAPDARMTCFCRIWLAISVVATPVYYIRVKYATKLPVASNEKSYSSKFKALIYCRG
jgi:hypothetical protein